MRRLLLLAVSLLALSLTSCLSSSSWHGDTVPFHGRETPRVAPCREVSRAHCDLGRCKGRNMDWVELQCAGGRTSRCVITRGCGTGD